MRMFLSSIASKVYLGVENMKKYKALKNISCYSKYTKKDEIVELDDKKAKAFLEHGMVEPVAEQENKKTNIKEVKNDDTKNKKV